MTHCKSLLATPLLAVLTLGLGGCPGHHEPLMIAAQPPAPQYPVECTAASDPEPEPPEGATAHGIADPAVAAREHRRALLWGRDLAGQRMICRAYISAYVAERWPATVAKSTSGRRVAAAGG